MAARVTNDIISNHVPRVADYISKIENKRTRACYKHIVCHGLQNQIKPLSDHTKRELEILDCRLYRYLKTLTEKMGD